MIENERERERSLGNRGLVIKRNWSRAERVLRDEAGDEGEFERRKIIFGLNRQLS
jgi:hypothetical protein